jgi:hypothetical protein
MTLSKNSKHSIASTTLADHSSHTIQMYALVHGCRDLLVCL